MTAAPDFITPDTITPDPIALPAGQTPAEVLLRLADQLTETTQQNLDLLMETDAPEPVHRARVALRRFRTLIEAFSPIINEDLTEALQDKSRALFRILGPIRDADVMVLRYGDTERRDKAAKDAAAHRQKGRKTLKRKRAERFRTWAMKRLSGKSWRQGGKKAKALRDQPVSALAARALGRAWATALSNGSDLAGMSPRAQHELRKDLKTLRYLGEFFADLWPSPAQDAFLAHLRRLQDDLGEITDHEAAKALGHDDQTDTSDPEDRARESWAAMVASGPWWA